MARNHRLIICIAGTWLTGCALPGITADYDAGTSGVGGANGGGPHSGGSSNAGGASNVGGKLSTGGLSNAGGTQNSGGLGAIGGASPAGGTAAGGITSSTGGSTPTAGASNSGGTASSTGGATSTGGSKPTGGTTSAAGTAATGGARPTGGATATGGTPSTGGIMSSGGTSAGKPIPVQISASYQHTCALLSDGSVWCWGDNGYDELGNATTVGYSQVAVKVTLSSAAGAVQAVASGSYHSCVLFSAGTVQCWGTNDYGQLGNGSTTSSTSPVNVMVNATTQLSNVVAIEAADQYNCALVVDTSGNRNVKCWGYGQYGELGNGVMGTGYFSSYAVTVITNTTTNTPLANVHSISMNYMHSCAVLNDNTVYCWGVNSNGQLGNGTTNDSSLPVSVVSTSGQKLSATSVSTEQGNTCALLTNSSVQCWGYNDDGELGDGTTVDYNTTPVTVNFNGKPISLAAGYQNACVVLDSGAVQCWGDNSYGQLGQDPAKFPLCNANSAGTSCSNLPINVTFPNAAEVKQVSVGGDYVSLLGTDGSIYSVGSGWRGDLGNGNTADTYSAVNVNVTW